MAQTEIDTDAKTMHSLVGNSLTDLNGGNVSLCQPAATGPHVATQRAGALIRCRSGEQERDTHQTLPCASELKCRVCTRRCPLGAIHGAGVSMPGARRISELWVRDGFGTSR